MKVLIPFLLAAAVTASAQGPLILLDPARGGSQGGSHIADQVEEKQVTLQVAQRLASLLRARGFSVEMTRDADTDTTTDQRAALANTTHPIACILLHASSTGRGVHLFTTTLKQPPTVDPTAPAAWDEAQAAYAARSQFLAADLRDAFGRTRLPVVAGTTWTRPLDNMQCPAVAVEMGPLKDGTGADDPPYQTRVTDTVAGVLLFWKNKVGSMTPPAPPKPVAPVVPTASGTTSQPAASSATVPAKPAASTPKPSAPPASSASKLPSAPSPAAKPASATTPKPASPKPVPATTPVPANRPATETRPQQP